MDLYIIRHAQSTNNILPIEIEERGRVCDPLLTELGHRQAERLAHHLATGRDGWSETLAADPEAGGMSPSPYGITRLVCSPMRRALLTTQPAGRALGLDPEIWLEIHEHGGIYLDHGEPVGRVGYPGITRGEVLAQFPGFRMPDALTETGWWRDGFEEWDTCLERAGVVARKLRDMRESSETIAMVTHGAFGSALIAALVGSPADPMVHFGQHNTGISLIHFRPDGAIRLRYLNRVPHLPRRLVS
jgi:2,3-bisphosphoglycerate-dependent phosphoglycerate mutase